MAQRLLTPDRRTYLRAWRKEHLAKGFCCTCGEPRITKLRCAKHNETHRAYERQRHYGITPAQYADLILQSGGLCAICEQAPNGKRGEGSLHVDHDHTTGVIRGLLCGTCNKGLGLFRDDVGRLEKVIRYLKKEASNGA